MVGICNYFPLCVFYIKSRCKATRISYCEIGGQTDFYYIDNSDFHCSMSGCVSKHFGSLSRLRIYRTAYSELSHNLLPQFYYGTARSTAYCRSDCKKIVRLDVQIRKVKRLRIKINFHLILICEKTLPIGSLITKSAWLSLGVASRFITTRYSPRK